MVIKGRDVFLEDLSLDGALLIDAVDDAKVSQDKLIKKMDLKTVNRHTACSLFSLFSIAPSWMPLPLNLVNI